MIEVDAARDCLRDEMGEPIEIVDPDVLDAAAAVLVGSRKSEGPGSSVRGLATSERTTADASYRPEQTAAS